MEVYATIFVIFLTNVLTSFGQTFSSWKKERGSQEKFRRIPIVYFKNHNNDEENQPETAVGYIMPFLEAYRERIPNRDSNRIGTNEANRLQRDLKVHTIDNNIVSGKKVAEKNLVRTKNWIIFGKKSHSFKYSSSTGESYSSRNSLCPRHSTLQRSHSNTVRKCSTPNFEFFASGFFHSTPRSLYSKPWQNWFSSIEEWNNDEAPMRSRCNRTNSCRNSPSAHHTIHYSKPWLFYTVLKHKTGNFTLSMYSNFSDKFDSLVKTTPISSYSADTAFFEPKNLLKNISQNVQEASIHQGITIAEKYNHRTSTEITFVDSNKYNLSKVTEKRIFTEEVYDKNLPWPNYLSTFPEYDNQLNTNSYQQQYTLTSVPYLNSPTIPEKVNIKGNKKREILIKPLSFIMKRKNRDMLKSHNISKRSIDYYALLSAFRGPNRCHEPKKTPGRKDSHYNLTELVYGKTLKLPFYHHKKRPQLTLQCADDCTTTKSTAGKGVLGANVTTVPSAAGNKTVAAQQAALGTVTNSGSTIVTGPSTVAGNTAVAGLAFVSPNVTVAGNTVVTVSNTTMAGNATVTGNTAVAGLAFVSPNVTVAGNTGVTVSNTTMAGNAAVTGNATVAFNLRSTTFSGGLNQILMRLENTTKVRTTPKHPLAFRVLVKNNDDSETIEHGFGSQWKNLLNLAGLESKGGSPINVYLSKVIRNKKTSPKPWDKHCSCESCCSDVTNLNRAPWVSTCCSKSGKSTKKPKRTTKESQGFKITDNPQPSPSSTGRTLPVIRKSHSLKPNIRYVDAKKENLTEFLQGNLNNTKNSVVVLVRVPSNSTNENISLPVDSKYLRKYLKPRSILDQLMPSRMKKTTLHPPEHGVIKPWAAPVQFKQAKFNLFTTGIPLDSLVDIRNKTGWSNNIVKVNDFYNTGHNQLCSTCRSCGGGGSRWKGYVLNAVTSRNEPIFNLLGENNQLYEETNDSEIFTNKDPCREECDNKCITYLLKLPKDGSIETDPFASYKQIKKVNSKSKTLKVIHSNDHPLKYFIEAPDSLNKMIKNIVESDYDKDSYVSKSEMQDRCLVKSSPDQLQLRPLSHKKPIVLRLQPFEVNGHKVYLPQTAHQHSAKSKLKDLSEVYDEEVEPEHPSCKRRQDEDLSGKNDCPLPFALIPAYLTFHPKSKINYELGVISPGGKNCESTSCNDKDVYMGSETPDELLSKDTQDEHLSRLMADSIPIEKKWIKLAHQIENTLQNQLPKMKSSGKRLVTTKRNSRINSLKLNKSCGAWDRKPLYLVVLKDSDDQHSKLNSIESIGHNTNNINKNIPNI